MPRSSRFARSPRALDVAAFCRDGASMEGELPLSDAPRVAESVLRAADGAAEETVRWSAVGSMQPVGGGGPQCVVDLAIGATATLECQRCLQPMAVPLRVERRFRFVAGEDEAARLDDELEEDVLALSPRFDLLALIEDELLLAMPLVPRHDACPDPPAALHVAHGSAATDAVEPKKGEDHPFAALAALRRSKS
jgi:uncharacterized protein